MAIHPLEHLAQAKPESSGNSAFSADNVMQLYAQHPASAGRTSFNTPPIDGGHLNIPPAAYQASKDAPKMTLASNVNWFTDDGQMHQGYTIGDGGLVGEYGK